MDVVRRLAELAVGVGANVQAGQVVRVSGEIGHLETVRAVAEEAYRRGAQFVDVRVIDPYVQRARIISGPKASLGYVPGWEVERVRELAELSGASIKVTGPTEPGLFDDLDPALVARASTGPSAEWHAIELLVNWTVVPAATSGWANRLRPELPAGQALDALWADLAYACRLDHPDPVLAWRDRLDELRLRADWLTELDLDVVRFFGPGTDLTVGLLAGARWERPELITPAGVTFVPNLPTEVVYTSPDPARVDGHVRLTRPALIGGRQINDVLLVFEQDQLVRIDGPAEADGLREFAARDRGAARLGELALVDTTSRLATLERTFGVTLLDENAASHIALGYGFPELMPPTNPDGANQSSHHLDLMIGSPHINTDGIDRHGTTHPLLRDGRWTH
ncbi:MAG TPA: aminopeptidase [Solirubrobacteraceae bacterium]